MKPERPSSLRNGFRFLGRFIARPGCVGAVWPSSPSLARAMAKAAGDNGFIVEVGPGTGALTPPLLEAVGPDGFLAVEVDPVMARTFSQLFPEVRCLEADAADLPQLLEAEGLPNPSAVVSGLPWAAFPPAVQQRILDGVLGALRPGGRFVTFAYLQGLRLPAGRRFRRLIDDRFDDVSVSPVVWRNLPPAIVYTCTKGAE